LLKIPPLNYYLMAVFIMNSLSYSLVINPFNTSVVPIQKAVKASVIPAHQTISQSNTSSAQQHNHVSSFRVADRESEFSPKMSTSELEHLVTTAIQDKVNETSADIQAQKKNLWELRVQQEYINSQKAAINAYVVSATGESTSSASDSLTNNKSLTDKYISLVEQEIKLRFDDTLKPSLPRKLPVPRYVNIQPVPETVSQLANQRVINHYNNVLDQGRSSLLHLSA
jgi:hypothetical protein